VVDLAASAHDAFIVRSIVDLAHQREREVVGVSRPLPAADLRRWLHEQTGRSRHGGAYFIV
jgi:hypothetical protein